MIAGRPVRFLACVVGGWTAMRVWLLPPVLLDAAVDPRSISLTHAQALSPEQSVPAQQQSSPGLRNLIRSVPAITERKAALISFRRAPHAIAMRGPARPAGQLLSSVVSAREKQTAADAATGARSPLADMALIAVPPPVRPARSPRWSGAAWALFRRDDVGSGRLGGGRLGGSQLGVRIDHALAPGSRLDPLLYVRASSALSAPAAGEVAIGAAIRPRIGVPLVLAVERRQAVSRGGRNDFALVAAAGLYDKRIGSFRLEGYAQAGVVGIRRRDAFADGRVTVDHVGGGHGLAFGLGAWGSAQPGAARLDIGPQANMRLRIGEAALRVGVEWRARVAGNAAPASGPAMSIAADF